MRNTKTASILLLIVLGMLTNTVLAASASAPHQLIKESSVVILQTIEEQRSAQGDVVNDEMVNALILALEPVVDFDAIARSVMGNHRAQASAEQIAGFTTVFKNSMVRLYMESFVAFEIEEVTVLDPAANFDPASGRATVRMQVTNSASTDFELSYSMRTNDLGEWKVRNIVVDGVNLGLTYLNQFDGAMSRYSNDLDKVIGAWSSEME